MKYRNHNGFSQSKSKRFRYIITIYAVKQLLIAEFYGIFYAIN